MKYPFVFGTRIPGFSEKREPAGCLHKCEGMATKLRENVKIQHAELCGIAPGVYAGIHELALTIKSVSWGCEPRKAIAMSSGPSACAIVCAGLELPNPGQILHGLARLVSRFEGALDTPAQLPLGLEVFLVVPSSGVKALQLIHFFLLAQRFLLPVFRARQILRR